jgi:hypothetical protein
MSLPSETASLWLCVLPHLPLDHECLRDCLGHRSKKLVDASSFFFACSKVHCLYVLNCLPGHGIKLPNCLEWHLPPPGCLEGRTPCILGNLLRYRCEHTILIIGGGGGGTDSFGLRNAFPAAEMHRAKYKGCFLSPFRHSLRWCLCLDLSQTH